jgi:hypothetical protein
MAIDIDKEGLDEIRRKMIALKDAIENYVDGIEIDAAKKKAGKAKKDMEDDDE